MRRWIVLAAVVTLLSTGGVTITAQVLTWLKPEPLGQPSPAVSDIEYNGAAATAAVDYLSWGPAEKATRRTATTRLAAPNVAIDGWDGLGRQWADSAAPIGLLRVGLDAALVTVRVRVVPFRQVDDGNAPIPVSDAGLNVATAPNPQAPGWTAQTPRWINLTVPLALRNGRVVVTAPPAPVGTPPAAMQPRPSNTTVANDDIALTQSTRDTVTMLMRSYGTGDLSYGRASGTTYGGLSSAAVLDSLTNWRVFPANLKQDGNTRFGDATVKWTLSGGAGKLTATYRIELRRQDDRWFLASVSAVTEVVT